MKTGSFSIFLLAFVLGLYLVYNAGPVVLIIGILSIAAGIAYTAGPFPLAYNGLGDIFVFMFFGVVGTTGTYYVQAKDFSWLAVLASIPVGALITNILVVNNFRDIEEDRAAGKNSGSYSGQNFCTAAIYIPYCGVVCHSRRAVLLLRFPHLDFLPYLTIPIAFKLINMLFTLEGLQLNKTLELTAKLSVYSACSLQPDLRYE